VIIKRLFMDPFLASSRTGNVWRAKALRPRS
jgi:hypothetical protein